MQSVPRLLNHEHPVNRVVFYLRHLRAQNLSCRFANSRTNKPVYHSRQYTRSKGHDEGKLSAYAIVF